MCIYVSAGQILLHNCQQTFQRGKNLNTGAGGGGRVWGIYVGSLGVDCVEECINNIIYECETWGISVFFICKYNSV